MDAHKPIQRILIVGGGTAGWMTAAYLNRFLHGTGCTITLVESSDLGTIGVGEATLPRLVSFVRQMKLDEDEFMRRCHATYKLGIKFSDWSENDRAYWHPFGLCGGRIDGIDLFHFWLKSARAGREEGPYSSYSLQALLGDTGKAPRPVGGSSPLMKTEAYAYHLDAGAFAGLLREIAIGEGVEHQTDDVGDVVLGGDGSIDHIVTHARGPLDADLYIDCTGFRGLLIEKALGDSWIDWSHLLLCDRAVVLSLPRDRQMHPYTKSTALSAGWVWRIPLSHRLGCGYVYSSAHASDDAAAHELLTLAQAGRPRPAEPRFLKMRIGRRQNFWAKNCVSVGLASGFIEPLESTGIFFIQRALELLIEYFPDRMFNDSLIRSYNQKMAADYEGARDFILLHYILSRRGNGSFWRDSRNIAVPPVLEAAMELYEETGKLDAELLTVFPDTSFYFILAGNEHLPRRVLTRADCADFAKVCEILDRIKAQNRGFADGLPTHRAFVEWQHRPSL